MDKGSFLLGHRKVTQYSLLLQDIVSMHGHSFSVWDSMVVEGIFKASIIKSGRPLNSSLHSELSFQHRPQRHKITEDAFKPSVTKEFTTGSSFLNNCLHVGLPSPKHMLQRHKSNAKDFAMRLNVENFRGGPR